MAIGRTHGGIMLRGTQTLSVGGQVQGLVRVAHELEERDRENFFGFVEHWARNR